MSSGWTNMCPKCGKKAGKSVKFCGDCGTELTSASEPAASTAEVLTVEALDEILGSGESEDSGPGSSPAPVEADCASEHEPCLEKGADESTLLDKAEPEEDTAADLFAPDGYRLEVVEGREKGASFEVPAGAKVSVGASKGADVCIECDPCVSRNHACFEDRDGVLIVRDAKSTNGTFVRIQESCELQEGDQVLLGKTLLRVTKMS